MGVPYRYALCANRSLGDLSARMRNNDQVSGYFDIEKPKFTLAQGPSWLKLDEGTGVLSGTPNAPGQQEVEVTAVIDREVRALDEKALSWGIERILSTNLDHVGSATQKFTLQVR